MNEFAAYQHCLSFMCPKFGASKNDLSETNQRLPAMTNQAIVMENINISSIYSLCKLGTLVWTIKLYVLCHS